MSQPSSEGPSELGRGQEIEQPATGKRSLGGSALKGIFWVGGGQAIKQAIAITTSIALARILAPEEFGVFAMIFFAMDLAQVFADFGFGSAIIQGRVSDSRALSTCFWLNMIIAALVAIVLSASGPLLSSFFSQPILTWLAIGCAFNILLTCSMIVPQALLVQRYDFRAQSQAQIVGSAVGALAAIGSALAGAGVWSLLVQPIAGSSVTLVLLFRAGRWLPQLDFELAPVRGMITFGAHLLAGNVVQTFGKNLHNIILGRSLGAAPLGTYNMAQGVTYFPIYQISAVVVKVLFPTLVDLNDEPARQRAAYEKVIGAIALVTFPCMAGLYAVAHDFVSVVFGIKWLDMVPVLQIMCWVVMLQSVATTASTVLLSKGRTKTLFHLSIVSTIMIGIGLLVGSRWGLVGTAWGRAIAGALYFVFLTVSAYKVIGLPRVGFVRAVRGPLMASLGMVAILAGLASILASLAPTVRLAIGIVIGAISYAGLTFLVNRAAALDVAKLVRSTLARRT